MQHSACVQHNTELYCKPLTHRELSLNRPPIGQYTAHYIAVSAVNLLLFFLSPPPPFPCSIVSGLTVAQTGLWVGSSTAHILCHRSQMSCVWTLQPGLWRVSLPSPHPIHKTSDKHSQAEQGKGWQRGKWRGDTGGERNDGAKLRAWTNLLGPYETKLSKRHPL